MKKIVLSLGLIFLLLSLTYIIYKPSTIFNNLYEFVSIKPYSPPFINIRITNQVQEELDSIRNIFIKKNVLYPKPAYSKVNVFSDNFSGKAKLKFKGDRTGHLSNENWSFKLKLPKGESWEGSRVTKFHHPKERNYINEYVFLKILTYEGLLAIDYDFAKVMLGDQEYLYATEEQFNKEYLENHQLKGAIIKFSEIAFWITREKNFIKDTNKRVNLFMDSKLIIKSNVKKFNKRKLVETLNSNMPNERMFPINLFDLKKCAKFIALSHIFGAEHGLAWHNLKFYYDVNSKKIELIGSDAMPRYYNVPVNKRLNHLFVFFNTSDEFNQLYYGYLKEFATDKYLYGFLLRNYRSIKSRINLLEQYYPDSDKRIAFIYANMEELQRQTLIE